MYWKGETYASDSGHHTSVYSLSILRNRQVVDEHFSLTHTREHHRDAIIISLIINRINE